MLPQKLAAGYLEGPDSDIQMQDAHLQRDDVNDDHELIADVAEEALARNRRQAVIDKVKGYINKDGVFKHREQEDDLGVDMLEKRFEDQRGFDEEARNAGAAQHAKKSAEIEDNAHEHAGVQPNELDGKFGLMGNKLAQVSINAVTEDVQSNFMLWCYHVHICVLLGTFNFSCSCSCSLLCYVHAPVHYCMEVHVQ